MARAERSIGLLACLAVHEVLAKRFLRLDVFVQLRNLLGFELVAKLLVF